MKGIGSALPPPPEKGHRQHQPRKMPLSMFHCHRQPTSKPICDLPGLEAAPRSRHGIDLVPHAPDRLLPLPNAPAVCRLPSGWFTAPSPEFAKVRTDETVSAAAPNTRFSQFSNATICGCFLAMAAMVSTSFSSAPDIAGFVKVFGFVERQDGEWLCYALETRFKTPLKVACLVGIPSPKHYEIWT